MVTLVLRLPFAAWTGISLTSNVPVPATTLSKACPSMPITSYSAYFPWGSKPSLSSLNSIVPLYAPLGWVNSGSGGSTRHLLGSRRSQPITMLP